MVNSTSRLKVVCRGLILLSFAWVLVNCGGQGGNSDSANTKSGTLQSTFTGLSYQYTVYLPENYDTITEALPTIYTLDGNERWFEQYVSTFYAANKAVILIGINNMNRRHIDFQLPQANNYFDFITLDLMPLIESEYNVDPAQRVLAGHSLGGLFVTYAMYLDNQANKSFSSFISYDGAYTFQRDQLDQLDQDAFDSNATLPVNLFLYGAESAFGPVIEDVHSQITSRNYQDLSLVLDIIEGDHVSVIFPSFEKALEQLFP